MSMSMNGQSRVPPGFRFHPTEEELLHYYLRKKVAYEKIDLDVIRDVDLNKLEPWEIQEKCKIGSTPQNDWYFFSHKDKKYPTGTRTNRATAAGFWKATGRDKVIYSSSKRIGMRKTLVFYKGRAPHGQKSDWIMHEYRLDDITDNNLQSNASGSAGDTGQEDGWVVCRIFKKKNLHKTLDSPNNSSFACDDDGQLLHSSRDGALDQILQYMGRACKKQAEQCNNINTTTNGFFIDNDDGSNSGTDNMRYLGPMETAIANRIHDQFMQLPPLERPTLSALSDDRRRLDLAGNDQTCYETVDVHVMATEPDSSSTNQCSNNPNPVYHTEPGFGDWATLDRLVASHLNGQSESCKQLACYNDQSLSLFSTPDQDLPLSQLRSSHRWFNNSQEYSGDADLWTFARSSSSVLDPLCHLSKGSV